MKFGIGRVEKQDAKTLNQPLGLGKDVERSTLYSKNQLLGKPLFSKNVKKLFAQLEGA